ncbi:MAG: hypothetical protein ACOYL6_06300 [Bacteriovoracaceae bacterium]
MKNLLIAVMLLGSVSTFADEPVQGIINKKTGDALSIVCASKLNDVCTTFNIALTRKNPILPVSYINTNPIKIDQLDTFLDTNKKKEWGEYELTNAMFDASGIVFDSLADVSEELWMDDNGAIIVLPPVAVGMAAAGVGVAAGGAVTFIAETTYKAGRSGFMGIKNLFVHGSTEGALLAIKNNEAKVVSNRKFEKILKLLKK